jgi:hypothetical protein
LRENARKSNSFHYSNSEFAIAVGNGGFFLREKDTCLRGTPIRILLWQPLANELEACTKTICGAAFVASTRVFFDPLAGTLNRLRKDAQNTANAGADRGE